jgi:hypothetical protein
MRQLCRHDPSRLGSQTRSRQSVGFAKSEPKDRHASGTFDRPHLFPNYFSARKLPTDCRCVSLLQVGDRLIPVGITSSRDPLAPLQLGDDTGRRGSRGRASGDLSQLLAGMGLSTSAAGGGQDIEDVSRLLYPSLQLLRLLCDRSEADSTFLGSLALLLRIS